MSPTGSPSPSPSHCRFGRGRYTGRASRSCSRSHRWSPGAGCNYWCRTKPYRAFRRRNFSTTQTRHSPRLRCFISRRPVCASYSRHRFQSSRGRWPNGLANWRYYAPGFGSSYAYSANGYGGRGWWRWQNRSFSFDHTRRWSSANKVDQGCANTRTLTRSSSRYHLSRCHRSMSGRRNLVARHHSAYWSSSTRWGRFPWTWFGCEPPSPTPFSSPGGNFYSWSRTRSPCASTGRRSSRTSQRRVPHPS